MSETFIHPTAVIGDDVQIGKGAHIGPYCVLSGAVTIGEGTILKSHVCAEGRITIGKNCTISPFVSFGPPQDLKYAGDDTALEIGDNCRIFEHVTMNTGTLTGGGVTRVGSNGHFMVGVHIAHDCQVGDNVIFANNATLGGHVHVGNHVVIGGLAAVHQFIRIGDFAVVGGMSGVENDVIPYGRVKGERAHLAGLNLIGIERSGLGKDAMRHLQRAYKDIFETDGTFEQRLTRAEDTYANDDLVRSIIKFSREKTRFPICQPKKESA